MKYFSQIKPLEFDLKIWRKNMKLSIRQLAQIVEMDYSYVYRVETGMYTMSAEAANKFFKKLNAWQAKKRPEIQYNFFPILSNF